MVQIGSNAVSTQSTVCAQPTVCKAQPAVVSPLISLFQYITLPLQTLHVCECQVHCMFSYLVYVVSSSLFFYPLLIFENSFGMLGERDVYLLIRYGKCDVNCSH